MAHTLEKSMKNEQRRHYLTRAGMLRVLSDAEIASVSAAEVAAGLDEGDEYIDLKHLDQGVHRARGATPPMGRVLPRKAVQEATWAKILKQLDALQRSKLN